MKEEPKSILDEIIFEKIKFIELYDSVNQLIQTKLTESISLPELKDNPDKKEFAKRGKEIHSQGDNCAFCGSKYTLEREQKLNIYFSADDIKILQDNLNIKLNEINEYKVKVSTLQGMKKEDFYISLHQEVQSLNFKISNKKNEIEVFLEKLENVIIDKQRDLFSAKNGLTIILPNNFDEEEKIVNELISKNNQYTTNFSEQHSEKKEQIKFHIISEYLNEKEKYKEGWKGHEVETFELQSLKSNLDSKKNELHELLAEIQGDEDSPQEGTITYLAHVIKQKLEEKNNL